MPLASLLKQFHQEHLKSMTLNSSVCLSICMSQGKTEDVAENLNNDFGNQ